MCVAGCTALVAQSVYQRFSLVCRSDALQLKMHGGFLQKAIGAGLLTSQQAGSVAAGAASVPELLAGSDVDNLFSSPVEVVAFCDEEGLR